MTIRIHDNRDCGTDVMEHEWALIGEDAQSLSRFSLEERFEVDDGYWSGYMDRAEVRPGIALYRMEAEVRHALSLLAADDAPEDTISLVLPLSGGAGYRGAGFRTGIDLAAGQILTCTTAERWAQMSFPRCPSLRIATMSIESHVFEELCGRAAPASLRRNLGGGGRPFIDRRPGANGAVHAMAELVASPYVGRLAHLHREARVLELIAIHFDALFAHDAGRRTLPADVLRKVRRARECLDADLRAPPTLDGLAREVGLDVKRLNHGFRELYGATAFDYLRQARLDAAHRLIADYPAIPLKQIAWRVGYAHVSNFCTAYRRRFGHPPRNRFG